MKLKELILKKLKELGIDLGENAEAVAKALEDIPDPEPAKPASTGGSSTGGSNAPASVDQDALARAIAEGVRTEMKPILEELEQQKSARTTAEEARQASEKRAREEQITKLLTEALKDGRITEEQKESWKTRLESGFETVEPILKELPANPAIGKTSVKQGETGSGTGSETGAPKSFRQMREDAAAELRAARESA